MITERVYLSEIPVEIHEAVSDSVQNWFLSDGKAYFLRSDPFSSAGLQIIESFKNRVYRSKESDSDAKEA